MKKVIFFWNIIIVFSISCNKSEPDKKNNEPAPQKKYIKVKNSNHKPTIAVSHDFSDSCAYTGVLKNLNDCEKLNLVSQNFNSISMTQRDHLALEMFYKTNKKGHADIGGMRGIIAYNCKDDFMEDVETWKKELNCK